jgi:hypothetical protein
MALVAVRHPHSLPYRSCNRCSATSCHVARSPSRPGVTIRSVCRYKATGNRVALVSHCGEVTDVMQRPYLPFAAWKTEWEKIKWTGVGQTLCYGETDNKCAPLKDPRHCPHVLLVNVGWRWGAMLYLMISRPTMKSTDSWVGGTCSWLTLRSWRRRQ